MLVYRTCSFGVLKLNLEMRIKRKESLEVDENILEAAVRNGIRKLRREGV